jgi:hypothetical protein
LRTLITKPYTNAKGKSKNLNASTR